MIGIFWLAISGVGLPGYDYASLGLWFAAPRAKRVTWRYPFERGRLCGFLNEKGQVVIPARYKRAHDFHGGVAVVETSVSKGVIGKQWRYIDPRGKTVWRPPSPKLVGKTLAPETIARGRQSRHKKRTFQTITSRQVFRRLWHQIWSRRYGRRWGRRHRGPPLPKVDFRKRSLVAVFQGTMGNTNSGIEIKRVVETKGEVVVFVTLATGMSACIAFGTLTSPWHIVAIPRRKKKHRFVINFIDACTHRGR